MISDLARQGGAALAGALGDDTLAAFARGLDRWKEGGALEIEVLEQSDERLAFNVTRCRYAEMYCALGLADLGASLSCQRDFALVESSLVFLERAGELVTGKDATQEVKAHRAHLHVVDIRISKCIGIGQRC